MARSDRRILTVTNNRDSNYSRCTITIKSRSYARVCSIRHFSRKMTLFKLEKREISLNVLLLTSRTELKALDKLILIGCYKNVMVVHDERYLVTFPFVVTLPVSPNLRKHVQNV